MKELIKLLDNSEWDAIVIEGYDGVGKGKLLRELSDHYGVAPYRPDYNMWQQFDHRKQDRWKVSGFFWDIYSHFGWHCERPMLFDRGVISGAVYNNDMNIARYYKNMLRDKNVLHVLVTCNKEDYSRFLESRGCEQNIESEYAKYVDYTLKYVEALDIAGVEYLIYNNEYDGVYADNSSDKCVSCGHYTSDGWCRHHIMNCKVDGDHQRCKYSSDREVQDKYDEQMCSL